MVREEDTLSLAENDWTDSIREENVTEWDEDDVENEFDELD